MHCRARVCFRPRSDNGALRAELARNVRERNFHKTARRAPCSAALIHCDALDVLEKEQQLARGRTELAEEATRLVHAVRRRRDLRCCCLRRCAQRETEQRPVEAAAERVTVAARRCGAVRGEDWRDRAKSIHCAAVALASREAAVAAGRERGAQAEHTAGEVLPVRIEHHQRLARDKCWAVGKMVRHIEAKPVASDLRRIGALP